MIREEAALELNLVSKAAQALGRPLAASAIASLWRCPKCGAQTHALLVVTADAYRCLSGYACSAGAETWLFSDLSATDEKSLDTDAT